MKTALLALALAFGVSFQSQAGEVWIPESPYRHVPIQQECRPVLIKRTTVYVDRYGCEVYRTVTYRRAYLCEDNPPPCRTCLDW